MHPHVAGVFTQLDEARSKLRAAVEMVPSHLRSQRPGDDRWSVNEILEHLSLVEQRFAGLIAMRIAEAQNTGVGPEQDTRDPFPVALRQMLADRANRRSAPEAVHPRAGLDEAAAWAAVERAPITDARHGDRGRWAGAQPGDAQPSRVWHFEHVSTGGADRQPRGSAQQADCGHRRAAYLEASSFRRCTFFILSRGLAAGPFSHCAT